MSKFELKNGILTFGGVEVPFSLSGEFMEIQDTPIPTPGLPVPPKFPRTDKTIAYIPVSVDYLTATPTHIGNNIGANIKAVPFDGNLNNPVYEFTVKHDPIINPNGTGARLFIDWTALKNYVGRTIKINYAKFMPTLLKPVSGSDKFLTFGAQSKYGNDEVLWNTNAEYNILTQRLSTWSWWLSARKMLSQANPLPLLPGRWIKDTIWVDLKTDSTGHISFAQDDTMILNGLLPNGYELGRTAGINGAGLGYALYTNAINEPITVYLTEMNVELAN